VIPAEHASPGLNCVPPSSLVGSAHLALLDRLAPYCRWLCGNLWLVPKEYYHLDSVSRVKNNAEIDQLGPWWRFLLDQTISTSLETTTTYRPMLPLSLAVGRAYGPTVGLEPIVVDHIGHMALHIM
jgi:hypothetical protein